MPKTAGLFTGFGVCAEVMVSTLVCMQASANLMAIDNRQALAIKVSHVFVDHLALSHRRKRANGASCHARLPRW